MFYDVFNFLFSLDDTINYDASISVTQPIASDGKMMDTIHMEFDEVTGTFSGKTSDVLASVS